ncbi:amidase family protein [Pseudaeromonas sp. ZJS20]|uniref:amidase n=1 Tax=Pseudaeromonas aegiceratis TaxID=3153928 RepID=UPI00390C5DEC
MIILPTKTLLSSLVVATLLTGCGDSKDTETVAEFAPVEGTIAQLHAALTAGTTSCEAVVQQYLDRIAAYDRTGPTLNSVIAVSDDALTYAREQDDALASGESMQPLQCVTVLLKDNIDTADMPTTAGGLALQYSQPEDDAYIVQRLREQGAIILGKANLDEFAFGYQGSSSVGGQVKNAYDQTKGPGGSSAGTGAAIAASFAMVGLGTDTGGSIRVPSSVEGLVGLRPSLRLVSQDGVVPLAHTQDTAGPMCRTVEDCALVMDALVGYDSASDSGQRNSYEYDASLVASAYEYQQVTGVPASYASGLSATALKGAHIGVVRALFGDGESEENQAVQAVLEAALAKMTAAGAVVEEVTIPNLDTILSTYKSVSRYEFCNDLTSYLSSWSNELDGHYTSFQEVADSLEYETRNQSTFTFYGSYCGDQSANTDYQLNLIERPIVVRGALMQALENLSEAGVSQGEPFDALVYPSILGLAPELGSTPTSGSNNRLSPFSGFPALTLPAGMADTDPALPVGIELLGREFDEQTLLNLAYGYEQVAQPRQAPTFTPAL